MNEGSEHVPAVTRCVCHDVLLAEIIRLHLRGHDIATIQRRTRFGTGCGACIPYVELALQSHRAAVPLLSPAAASRFSKQADQRKARD